MPANNTSIRITSTLGQGVCQTDFQNKKLGTLTCN